MDKKQLIVESAINLFQNKGIDKTTVSDIVKQANIAQGTFYLYFPSKLALMPAIAEEMVKISVVYVEEKLPQDQSIDVQLKHIVNSIFTINEQYSELLALIYSGLASTEHLKEWEVVYEPFYKLISQLLDVAKTKGEIDKNLDSHRTAKLMIGLVESAAEQVFLFDYPDKQEIENQKEAVIQFLFAALKIKAK